MACSSSHSSRPGQPANHPGLTAQPPSTHAPPPAALVLAAFLSFSSFLPLLICESSCVPAAAAAARVSMWMEGGGRHDNIPRIWHSCESADRYVLALELFCSPDIQAYLEGHSLKREERGCGDEGGGGRSGGGSEGGTGSGSRHTWNGGGNEKEGVGRGIPLAEKNECES
jgi:uncharacterized membrane protein YgcG